mgnify:CR=1 FL=1
MVVFDPQFACNPGNIVWNLTIWGPPHENEQVHVNPAVEVIEVADKTVLGDGARSIVLYRIANGHAEGMLIAYLPDVKLGYVTDLWAPGRDTEFGTARQRALVDAVEKAGIRPERFAGGHGSVASYPEFAAKVKGAK